MRPTEEEAVQAAEDTGGGELLLVSKPKGWTSFDVVSKIRRLRSIKKVGHAGTLDPLATGLLIVATGKLTKQLNRYQELEKEYNCTMKLGERTESFDSETQVMARSGFDHVTRQDLLRVMKGFLGRQLQIPPMYSAVKVGGIPLYRYARKGKTVDRVPREVVIHSLGILRFEPPEVVMNVVCSKGTYVRTLVDEVGIRLGCGAHVTALERVRIGAFLLKNAITLEEVGGNSNLRHRSA